MAMLTGWMLIAFMRSASVLTTSTKDDTSE